MNNARQKLLKLSQQHFLELTTDVYDELQRRLNPLPAEIEHLMSREDIHPKRNQARQKLSVLAPNRFRDLATDIMYEIERRYEGLRPLSHARSFSEPMVPEAPIPQVPIDATVYDDGPHVPIEANSDYHEGIHPNQHQEYAEIPFGSQDNGVELLDPVVPMDPGENNGEYHDAKTDFENNGRGTHDKDSQMSAEPLRQTTIIPKKSTLVEEDDSEDEMANNDGHGHLDNEEAAMAGTADVAALGPRTSNDSTRRSVSFDRNSISLASIAEEDQSGGHDDDNDDDLDLAKSISENKIAVPLTTAGAGPGGPAPLSVDGDVYAQLKDKDEQIQMLVEEGSRMDDTINRLEAQLKQSESMKSTLMEENERLHNTLSDLEKERQTGDGDEETAKRLEELSQKHANTIDELQSIGTQHEDTLAEKASLEQKVEELKQQLARISEESEGSASAVLENQQLKGLLDQLQSELANVQSERDTLQSHKTSLTERNTELEQKVALHEELQKSMSEEQPRIAEVQSQLAALTLEHEAVVRAHKDADGKLSDLQSAHSGLQDQFRQLQDTHDSLVKMHNDLKAACQGGSCESGMAAGAAGLAAGAAAGCASGSSLSGDELKAKYDQLAEDHANLQKELERQQRITDQVREEASAFLVEMRTIAESQKTNESLVMEVQTLKMEVQEWKSRYSKAKSEVRNLKAASTYGTVGTLQPNFGSFGEASPYFSPYGRVRSSNVAKFQVAMDEFVSKSRQHNVDLLQYLHNVIVATRMINQEIFEYDDLKSSEGDNSNIAQCSSLVSRTANQFITTTRNHCVAGGLSPYSILDAAASDLSFAVIELLKSAKIRTSDTMPESDTQPSPVDDKFDHKDRRRYASIQDPSAVGNFNTQDPDVTVTELQGYLEERTAGAIESTQSLLTGIKSNATVGELRPHMRSINNAVNHMIEATSTSMKQSRNWLLKDKGSYIVQNLADCTQRMNLIYEDLRNVSDDSYPDRQVKQRLAGISYDMAKGTKELVKTVEEVSLSDTKPN
jgi:hypothetical protein